MIHKIDNQYTNTYKNKTKLYVLTRTAENICILKRVEDGLDFSFAVRVKNEKNLTKAEWAKVRGYAPFKYIKNKAKRKSFKN